MLGGKDIDNQEILIKLWEKTSDLNKYNFASMINDLCINKISVDDFTSSIKNIVELVNTKFYKFLEHQEKIIKTIQLVLSGTSNVAKYKILNSDDTFIWIDKKKFKFDNLFYDMLNSNGIMIIKRSCNNFVGILIEDVDSKKQCIITMYQQLITNEITIEIKEVNDKQLNLFGGCKNE